jgi:hypothetical protein
MADRKDGKPKRGTGKALPRTHTVDDLIGTVNRSPKLIEDPLWPILFKRGVCENRAWHDKGFQELFLATGWKTMSSSTIAVSGRIPELHRHYFFIDFPLSYARSRDRYSLQSCRLYLGRIEMKKCRKAHRCGIVDIRSENPFRQTAEGEMGKGGKYFQRKREEDKRSGSIVDLELVVEEICECFNEEGRDHEGTIFLYHRG